MLIDDKFPVFLCKNFWKMNNDISLYVNYHFTNETCKTIEDKVIQPSINQYLFNYPCESTTTCAPFRVNFKPGIYRFELWGAQGGNSRLYNTTEILQDAGGKGAYVKGILNLHRYTTFYFYIGGKGENQDSLERFAFGRGGYNGGGDGGADLHDYNDPESAAGGGGATDIRLISNENDENISLKSRIAVAAGGGGGATTLGQGGCDVLDNPEGSYICNNHGFIREYRGSPAGALFGYVNNDFIFAPNQTNGIFGKGLNGLSIGNDDMEGTGGSIGGAGGGYYGGTCITENEIPNGGIVEVGGAGGSSYISGYEGCNSVNENPKQEIEHSNSKYHYSGYIFREPGMLSGLESFKNEFGNEEKGHSDSGAILVTLILSTFTNPTLVSLRCFLPYCLISLTSHWIKSDKIIYLGF